KAEKEALEKGYIGLRAVGVMSWVERDGWDKIVGYEAAVDSVLNRHKILALCCYPLTNLEIDEVINMVSNHAMVTINRNGRLMAIGNSRQTKVCIMKSNDLSYAKIGSKMGISRQRAHQLLNEKIKYRSIFNDMLTSTEAATRLRVHVNTLRRWSNEDLLPVYRIGSRGDRRFKTEDIEKFVLKTRQKQAKNII
ncbi:MAG: MEDS domain-containing protein, partial [Dehalococcoidia bacterium]